MPDPAGSFAHGAGGDYEAIATANVVFVVSLAVSYVVKLGGICEFAIGNPLQVLCRPLASASALDNSFALTKGLLASMRPVRGSDQPNGRQQSSP